MDVQLRIIEEEFTLENWRAEGSGDAQDWAALKADGRKHAKELSKLQWKVADWLLRAKEKGRLSNDQLEAEAVFIHRQMSITTIWRYLGVAERFRGDSRRRRESLSFSHHSEVAIDEFDDATQDRLLDQAERRGLDVRKLRSLANTEKKRYERRNRAELKKSKKVAIRLSPDTFKLLKKLAYARGYNGPHRRYDHLLQTIVTEHLIKFFQDTKILQEIEEWQARVKLPTEARTIRKADKAKREALRVERKRFEDYFFDLRSKTGQPAPQFIKKYLDKECGHAPWLEIPLSVFEDVIAKVKEAGDDPHEQVKRLQTLSEGM